MKNMRRLAMARIHADSTLSRQHWTASGGWHKRILRAISYYVILPVSVIIIGVVFVILGAALGELIRVGPAVDFLASVAGIAVITSFSHAGWTLRELVGSRSLAVTSVIPDADSTYVSSRINSSLKKTLVFLVVSLLLGVGFTIGAELNIFDTILVLLLSLLLWLMAAALSVIIPAFLPFVARQEVSTSITGLMVLLFLSASMVVALGIARKETVVFAALVSLPTGWPILMLKYGVILKQPDVWWLLVPAGCVVVTAIVGYSRLLSRYRIQEFNYEPGALASAEFRSIAEREIVVSDSPNESSLATPVDTTSWLRDRRQRLNLWFKLSDANESSEELTRNQAITRIREAGLTKRFDWSKVGLIERTVAKLRKDEELLSAEILSCGRPQWSRGMARALVPATAAVAFVVIAAFFVHRQIAMICGHLGIAGLVGALAGSRWSWLWRSGGGDVCAAMALLPVDDRHVSRVVMTLGAIRSVLIFPFAASVIAAVTWGQRGQFNLADAALLSAKAALIIVAVHQWWFLVGQPCTSSRTIRKAIQDIIVAVAVVVTMIVGVCLLLMPGHSETWATIGAGLLFGTGWTAHRIQRRNILNSSTDFVMNRTAQVATTQRQQKSRRTEKVPTFWPRPIEPAEMPL